MKKIKIKIEAGNGERALILGLIIGVFLLPVVNTVVPQGLILYANLILVFAMPLLALAGIFFLKILTGGNAALWQFAKFFLIGLANTAVNVGIFNYFINATGLTRGTPLVIITAVSFLAALVNSYIWNTHWAFREGFTNSIYQFERFFVVTFVGLLVNTTAVIMITTLFYDAAAPKIIDNIGNLFGILCAMVWNFIGYKYFVFNKKKKWTQSY